MFLNLAYKFSVCNGKKVPITKKETGILSGTSHSIIPLQEVFLINDKRKHWLHSGQIMSRGIIELSLDNQNNQSITVDLLSHKSPNSDHLEAYYIAETRNE